MKIWSDGMSSDLINTGHMTRRTITNRDSIQMEPMEGEKQNGEMSKVAIRVTGRGEMKTDSRIKPAGPQSGMGHYCHITGRFNIGNVNVSTIANGMNR